MQFQGGKIGDFSDAPLQALLLPGGRRGAYGKCGGGEGVDEKLSDSPGSRVEHFGRDKVAFVDIPAQRDQTVHENKLSKLGVGSMSSRPRRTLVNSLLQCSGQCLARDICAGP